MNRGSLRWRVGVAWAVLRKGRYDPYEEEFPHTVLIGFEEHPDPDKLYPGIEALGAVVLQERQAFF
jgi:hypothetical protein